MWFSGFFFSYFVSHSWGIPMMKITGLSHLFKWENLHNWWLTKYFFAPLYIHTERGLCRWYDRLCLERALTICPMDFLVFTEMDEKNEGIQAICYCFECAKINYSPKRGFKLIGFWKMFADSLTQITEQQQWEINGTYVAYLRLEVNF